MPLGFIGNAGDREFLASNSGGRQDADGDSSDWLEIYNPGTTDINLAGWTFGVNSDDGFGLRLKRNGVVLTSEYFNPRGAEGTHAVRCRSV